MQQNIGSGTAKNILDIGCSTGLLGLAAKHFITDGGSLTGIDVRIKNIEFCKEHFELPGYEFIHFDVSNGKYNQDGSLETKKGQ